MKKNLYILCNSNEAMATITSGSFKDLADADIFTCNNAFTFVRTNGKHFNFWTDTRDIMRHIEMPENLSLDYHTKVQHIYSPFGITMANGNELYQGLCVSPVKYGCSSAIGALAFAAICLPYDKIVMIGHTLDEFENPIFKQVIFNYLKLPSINTEAMEYRDKYKSSWYYIYFRKFNVLPEEHRLFRVFWKLADH